MSRDNNKSAYSGRRSNRKKVCNFCVTKATDINYITLVKDIEKGTFDKNLEKQRPRFVTEKGKIIPRRISGVCVRHQRLLATAIKRARLMALLPFKAE
ncbi:MAG: 30S ribosomal protein S18 [Christensenellaceae bacterium]|jgi:small subunit ribosomal protein S18|nr:30S ribosomal protein S18 [Christensenellaceae bacterium]